MRWLLLRSARESLCCCELSGATKQFKGHHSGLVCVWAARATEWFVLHTLDPYTSAAAALIVRVLCLFADV